jgi:hypothetical protein
MDQQQKFDPQRRYRVLDSQTGESRLAITWFRKKWKGNTFFMGFQEGFTEIARKRLGSEAKDVFLFIVTDTLVQNYAPSVQDFQLLHTSIA